MPDASDPDHQPNDKLFKSSFSKPSATAAFLKHHLSKELVSHVDWTQLQLLPGSFIDSQFRHSESDLLFKTSFFDSSPESPGALFYLLFEHQRTPDAWIALRLLRYMVRIWENFLREHRAARELPVILPVVLAQNDKAWNLRTQFARLFGPPGAVPSGFDQFIPHFCFALIELAGLPYDKIFGTPEGILTLRVLKAERQNALLDSAVWDENLLGEVSAEIFERILRYIFQAPDVDMEKFMEKVDTVGIESIKGNAMTLAQQFREEGISQGISQGRQQALREDILDILEVRFGECPEALSALLKQITDETRLRELLRRAVLVGSLHAFRQEI